MKKKAKRTTKKTVKKPVKKIKIEKRVTPKPKKEEKIKCPYCKSSRVVWRGYRYNEKTDKHLRLCNNCKRKFTKRDEFFRMRFGEEEIKRAVELYKKGYSSAEVVQNLKRNHGIKVSRWTVICWHKRYTK
ncbi:MAG: hypothetical protein ABIJ92_04335 [Candidatus Aenigmatarchaeota archaeon]